MKLYKLLLAAAAVATSAAMVSCDNDFDRPPVIVPVSSMEANTTIADLKAAYWEIAQNATNQMVEIGKNDSGQDIIVSGRVISFDEPGNVFKTVILQDESSAIAFRVNEYDLYEAYPIGQEVFVNVTGLTIGFYNNLMQIGTPYTNSSGNTSVGNMDGTLFKAHAERNGLGGANLVEPYTVTIAELEAYKANLTDLQTWQYRLVRIKDVSFVGGGTAKWGDPTAANYTTNKITDADGRTLDVSTSNKCSFAGQIMPPGTGEVIAVLSYFRSNWQLVFNDPESGCIGFDPVPDTPQPGGPVDAVASLTTDFESGSIPQGWATVATSGNRDWIVKSFNDNYYAQCSAYGGTPGTNGFSSWLITAPLNMDAMNPKVMSFTTEIQYGDQEGELHLYAMTTADPTTATLTELSFKQPEAGSKGSTGYVASGEISLAQFSGTIYIGWLYTAKDKDNSRTYRIDDVKIGTTGGGGGDTPDVPVTGVLYSGLDATQATCDWTLTNVTMPEGLTSVWSWKTYNGASYLNASTFVNNAACPGEGYATSPVIDLTAVTSAKVFEHAAKFQTTLKSLCGFQVKAEGSDTWTDLTIPTWPAAGGWVFVSSGDIDLKAYCGKKIQLRFKYGASSAGADTWEIRNLKVQG